MKAIFTILFFLMPTIGVATTATSKVMTAFSYNIPDIKGKKVTAVVVEYPPGGSSAPHRHGEATVIAYVLEGAIRSKIEGQQEKVYKAGESWLENPGAHHVVSANASEKEGAKLIAFLIADISQKDIVVPDQPTKH